MESRKSGERLDITKMGAQRVPSEQIKDDQLQRIEDKLDQLLAILTKTP